MLGHCLAGAESSPGDIPDAESGADVHRASGTEPESVAGAQSTEQGPQVRALPPHCPLSRGLRCTQGCRAGQIPLGTSAVQGTSWGHICEGDFCAAPGAGKPGGPAKGSSGRNEREGELASSVPGNLFPLQ